MLEEDLANRIIQEQRKLLEALAGAAERMGWRCQYVVMSLDGSDLAADVRLTLGPQAPAAMAGSAGDRQWDQLG